MLIATFDPTTQWAGRSITYEGRQFILEDHGPVSAQQVLEYDRQAQLQWAHDGLREWTGELAASTPEVPVQSRGSVGVGGFVWSLVGFVFAPAWIVGLVMSRAAMKRAESEQLHGGLALAGFIISVIGCVLLLLMVVFLVAGYSGDWG
jgi:hypothetical protein